MSLAGDRRTGASIQGKDDGGHTQVAVGFGDLINRWGAVFGLKYFAEAS